MISRFPLHFIVVTCGNPANVPFSTNTRTGVNVGDSVTYTCDGGYAVSGQSVATSMATCAANGTWATIQTCVGK